MNDVKFFGYKHWTLETVARCFYVGKGKKGRAENQKQRNHKWKAIAARLGVRVEICIGPVTNEEACAWEIENIALERTFSSCHHHNSCDIGCNFTYGGEGNVGFVYSDGFREKCRQRMLGQTWSSEKRNQQSHLMSTPEMKKKLSDAQLQSEVREKKRQSMIRANASEQTKKKRKQSNERLEVKQRRSEAQLKAQNNPETKIKRETTLASDEVKLARAITESLPETKLRRSNATKLVHAKRRAAKLASNKSD